MKKLETFCKSLAEALDVSIAKSLYSDIYRICIIPGEINVTVRIPFSGADISIYYCGSTSNMVTYYDHDHEDEAIDYLTKLILDHVLTPI